MIWTFTLMIIWSGLLTVKSKLLKGQLLAVACEKSQLENSFVQLRDEYMEFKQDAEKWEKRLCATQRCIALQMEKWYKVDKNMRKCAKIEDFQRNTKYLQDMKLAENNIEDRLTPRYCVKEGGPEYQFVPQWAALSNGITYSGSSRKGIGGWSRPFGAGTKKTGFLRFSQFSSGLPKHSWEPQHEDGR